MAAFVVSYPIFDISGAVLHTTLHDTEHYISRIYVIPVLIRSSNIGSTALHCYFFVALFFLSLAETL